MILTSFYRFFGAIVALFFVKVVKSSPLLNNEFTANLNQLPELENLQLLESHQLDQVSYLQERSDFLKEMYLDTDGNEIFNEMFDNITDHFIEYSNYLASAPTKDLLVLRVKLLKSYSGPAQYSGAEAKFDRFVLDFRTDTRNFDKFAFSTVDFLIFPSLGVNNYSATDLARVRSEVIQTIPQSATETQRKDFIDVIDTIISEFPNGKDLQNYFLPN